MVKQSMSDTAVLAISRDAIRRAMEHMEFNEVHIRDTINAVLGFSSSGTSTNATKTKLTQKKARKPYVASNKVKAQQAFVKENKDAVRAELEQTDSFNCTNSKGDTKVFWANAEERTKAKLSAATTAKCSQMWNSLSEEDKTALIEKAESVSSDNSSGNASENDGGDGGDDGNGGDE